ncbi:MAG: hypothetical protein ACRDSK_09555 [Actinophytocola sp.]|uniref:hypothetical protein n=1 Tax=Actinophytocola sp. TaxID=1872138 RepID=UPI003D6BAD73
MALPPGRDAVSVPGLDDAVNPQLTRAAGEVGAWIEYLLRPEDNDGPRVYRSRFDEGDNPFPRRNEDLDSKSHEFETVSILADYANDPDALLRPVQAIAGLRHDVIGATYDKLLDGYFTWSTNDTDPGPEAIDDKTLRYFEMNSARMDWAQMRTGWVGAEANAAYMYEKGFIRFQLVNENCLYIIAEHLARYSAIFDKAGRDLLELMDAFTTECANYEPTGGGDLALDVMSIVVDVIIGATVTVLTGGIGTTAKELLKGAASTALSNGMHQAAAEKKEKHLTLDKHYDLRDTTRQYLERVEAIEREVADAVNGLAGSLRRLVAQKRELREYETDTVGGPKSTKLPHPADFMPK